MSLVATILVDIAAKVGAPLIKGILEKHVGGTAGEIGGTVIDVIAEKAGVSPEELPDVHPAKLEQAVMVAEAETADLILAHVEQQKETNRLFLAEMTKPEGFISWGWRPSGMWLMLVCIAWYIIVVPLLNTVLTALGATTTIVLIVDFATFVPIFMTFAGLYMGGNTVIRAVEKAKK